MMTSREEGGWSWQSQWGLGDTSSHVTSYCYLIISGLMMMTMMMMMMILRRMSLSLSSISDVLKTLLLISDCGPRPLVEAGGHWRPGRHDLSGPAPGTWRLERGQG